MVPRPRRRLSFTRFTLEGGHSMNEPFGCRGCGSTTPPIRSEIGTFNGVTFTRIICADCSLLNDEEVERKDSKEVTA